MVKIFTVHDDSAHASLKSFYSKEEAEKFLIDQANFQEHSLRIIESELTYTKITLEKYFRENYHNSVEYWVRVDITGSVYFIIKPMHIQGDTLQFQVVDNGLEPVV